MFHTHLSEACIPAPRRSSRTRIGVYPGRPGFSMRISVESGEFTLCSWLILVDTGCACHPLRHSQLRSPTFQQDSQPL